MKVSQLVQAVPPSATLAVTSRAKEMKAQGIDVLGFAAGEPDFDTPDFIKEAAVEALKKGLTKYTPAAGTPEFRKAIAEKLKRENNLNYTWDQVVVNIGDKHSIFMAMQVALDPGDEVLLPAPLLGDVPGDDQAGRGQSSYHGDGFVDELQNHA